MQYEMDQIFPPYTQSSVFRDIKDGLRRRYLEDPRPWLVGFSGGKDSTMLASLVFEVVLSIPAGERKKPVSVLCTHTRVEITAIAEMHDEFRLERTESASRTGRRHGARKRSERRHLAPTGRES